jgi:hypothetical protein
MTEQEARAYYNYLITLSIRREEAFGPLSMAFIRKHDLDKLGLQPEEQLNLFIATAQAFPAEPRRYSLKLEFLKSARQTIDRIDDPSSTLVQHLDQEIQKTSAELDIYSESLIAARTPATAQPADKQSVVFETDLPHYVLSVAQKRAMAYYRKKYRLTEGAKIGLNFKGPTRRFEPENAVVHKDLAAACAPFMSARTTPFHLMLPFDVKISRKPTDALEAGFRIWYTDAEYSFPLRYAHGQLCSWYDDQVVNVAHDDPHLRFVSVSEVKEKEIGVVERPVPNDVPLERGLAQSFLDGADALGPYIQFGCNLKVWFDADAMSILTQGAPDLHEYGLVGGAGILTRTYATEKVAAYAQAMGKPWQEGLSFNYINIHLLLQPTAESAFVPFNTPLFSIYFLLNSQQVEIKDRRTIDEGLPRIKKSSARESVEDMN